MKNLSNILHDFVEKVIVFSIDKDEESIEVLGSEFYTFYKTYDNKETLEKVLLSIIRSSDDPAMDFFTPYIIYGETEYI